MSFYDDLTEQQREQLSAPLRARIQQTENAGWRLFWEARLVLLQRGTFEGAAALKALTSDSDHEVRSAAFQTLGEIYRSVGDEQAALRMFEAAEHLTAKPAYSKYLQAKVHLGLGSAIEGERLLRDAILSADDERDVHWLQSAVPEHLKRAFASGKAVTDVVDHLHKILAAKDVRRLVGDEIS